MVLQRRLCLGLIGTALLLDPRQSEAAGKSGKLKAGDASPEASFKKGIAPLLEKYCYDCHGDGMEKGGVALDSYKDFSVLLADRKTWGRVEENVRNHMMPPAKKKEKPTPGERERILAWIERQVFQCDCDHPEPGRVTIRRLNRAEYANTIRDLIGVKFAADEEFPADDSGYGFDNIGDVLSLPPVLLEKYLAAAEQITAAAIVTDHPGQVPAKRLDATELDGSAPGEPVESGVRRLGREGDIYVKFKFPQEGDYLLRALAYGEQAGDEPPKMTLRLNETDVHTFEVPVKIGEARVYEVKVHAKAGTNRFAAAYINNFVNRAKRQDRNLVIEWLEIVGPVDVPPPALPASHKRIFFRTDTPTERTEQLEYAREILLRFATRAYRRPMSSDEVERLLPLAKMALEHNEGFENAVQLALQAVLVSPQFLFRGEIQPEPDNPSFVHPIDEYALASRLSYFLWSSMPDDELFAQAARKTLRKNLDRQMKRMLKDPKSRALVDNFAGQWLQLRNITLAAPDVNTFPAFDEKLRTAMLTETELFFENVIREDRSVLDFLNAKYTFVNERLASHYGLSGLEGEQFQRVSLKGTPRSGILTHAGILLLTSNPTRTSPVKRGKYVLENILGAPPPPPPPDVPELKEDRQEALKGTLRQRMEQHRSKTLCASCHARMDPIGFGFENFDAIGAWRDKDGAFTVEAGGELLSGESFNGPKSLTEILVQKKRDNFVRCLAEKLLTYALGRGMEYSDRCAIDGITQGVSRRGYRFSALVSEIVKSVPFQQRRGESDHPAKTAALR
jgi:hypothetical protein